MLLGRIIGSNMLLEHKNNFYRSQKIIDILTDMIMVSNIIF